jgi:hypothetical protein
VRGRARWRGLTTDDGRLTPYRWRWKLGVVEKVLPLDRIADEVLRRAV